MEARLVAAVALAAVVETVVDSMELVFNLAIRVTG